jgi:exosortase A-associated hydrolase 2
LEALFLAAGSGQRLLVCHTAHSAVRGGVVYVPPFAEEMNKARRMATLQARALAAAGWTVALPDLAGCGDSSGELHEVGWDDWIDDVRRCVAWLRERVEGPIWLWGLRLGCLLAAEVAQRDPALRRLLLWQPPAAGKPLLQQFLRLRMASALERGAHRGVVEQLRADLASGRSVEVAGYELPPLLARAIDSATLVAPAGPGMLRWREVASDVDTGLLPAGEPVRARWAQAGWHVDAVVRPGPAFWQTTEIETAPALIEPALPEPDVVR